MQIISYDLKENIKLPEEIKRKIKNNNYCFFDIETTGFNRYKSRVILVGILYPSYEGSKIVQFFAESLEDEKELLIKFIAFVSKFNTLISFNGDTFDIPFLNSRIKSNLIDYEFDKSKNIDLLKIVRKNKDILGLENCKLKTVEKKIDIYRSDLISGKESVDLYYEFIRSKQENLKNIILGHNYDDIFYLPKILKIYDLINDKSNIAYFHLIDNKKVRFNMNLRDINLREDRLYIKGKSDKIDIRKQIFYESNYTFDWDAYDGLYNLNLTIDKGKLSTGKDCYYLDQHKYDLPIDIVDKTDYKIPQNLVIIKDNKKFINDNIGDIFQTFMNQILNRL